MKRKIFSILFALVLVLTLGLATAVPIAASSPGYTLLETLTVSATSAVATSSTTTLLAGWSYKIEASGTYSAAAGITADAEYSSGPTSYIWQEPVEKYEGYGVNLLDLKVDGAFVDWGAYNASHVYALDYVGTGSTVTFLIYDLPPYSNNSGSLTVKIYGTLMNKELVLSVPALTTDTNSNGIDEAALATPYTFTMLLTVTNQTGVMLTNVVVKERLGAELQIDNPSPGAGVSVTAGTFSPWTKGKSAKWFIDWYPGDLAPGASATLTIKAKTDLNPAGHQEYTSPGIYELNSGAALYAMAGAEEIYTRSNQLLIEVLAD